MRHRDGKVKLNRDASHRKALLRNMADSLILNDKIETTVAKAKYLRPYIERLITRAKKDTSFTSIKFVERKLATTEAVRKLFADVAPRFTTRNGGYTRIVRTGNRAGDNADIARIEFVEKKASEKAKAKKATTKKTEKPLGIEAEKETK